MDTTKTKLIISFLIISTLLLYPFSLLTFSTNVNMNFVENQEKIKENLTEKINQVNNQEYVESFDNYWSDRYEEDQLNGTYSRWDSSLDNGEYSFEKWEDTTTFENAHNESILSTEYQNFINCKSFSGSSNSNCENQNYETSALAGGAGAGTLLGWSYREQIQITGSPDGSLTNYNMEFFLYYGSGTDSTDVKQFKIYLDSRSNTDFSDIRFTADDGTTLLTHYAIDVYSSDYAQVIVNVPSIPTGTTTDIFIYYGNPLASSTSNNSLIEFYDDFNSGITAGEWSTQDGGAGDGGDVRTGQTGGDYGVAFDLQDCTGSGCFGQLVFDDVDGANQFSTTQSYKIYQRIYIENITSGRANLQVAHQTRTPSSAQTRTQYDQSYANNRELVYNHPNIDFEQTTPNIEKWDVAGTNRLNQHWVSFDSGTNNYYLRLYQDDDYLTMPNPEQEYVDPSSLNGELRYINMNWQGLGTGSDKYFAWLLEFAIIEKTENEPTILITDSVLSTDYVGYEQGNTTLSALPYDLENSDFTQLDDLAFTQTSRGFSFNNDGTEAFFVNFDGDVETWNLSTPYDFSTAVFWYEESFTLYATFLTGIDFKPDGTKMYLFYQYSVREFDLDPAWSVVDYTNVGVGTLSALYGIYGCHFGDSGSKIYCAGGSGGGSDYIGEYSLSSAWTASTLSTSYNEDIGTTVHGVGISGDGTQFYASVGGSWRIYDLATAWDLSSNSLDTTKSVGGVSTQVMMEWKPDGLEFYSSSTGGDIVQRTITQTIQYSEGGIKRFFPAVDVDQITTLEALGATVPEFEHFKFRSYIDNSYLLELESIQVFLYTYNSSEVLFNTTLESWTTDEINYFWNTTSQPLNASKIYIKDFNFTETPGNYYTFDILDLAEDWFDNRLTGNTVFGIGIQLYELNDANNTGKGSSYISLGSYFDFDYELLVDYNDVAYKDLSLNVEKGEELVSSVGFSYEQGTNTNLTNSNYFEFSVAIETYSTQLVRTHYMSMILYDPSGEVFVGWRTTSGAIVSYSTGVFLEDQKTYRFTFDISKTDGRLAFSILNVTGDALLRPTTWQTYTTSDIDYRPSFFGAEPLLRYYDGNSTTADHRRGYNILMRSGSTGIVTGATAIHIDQIYSSNGLLDTEYFCKPQDNFVDGSGGNCNDYSAGDFDDINAYGAHWNNLSTTTRVTYQNRVRDFRSFTGIAGINSTDDFSNDQALELTRVVIQVEPLDKDGNTLKSLSVFISLNNYSGGYNVLGIATDNITNTMFYPDLPAGKPSINFAYGFYFQDERTIGLQIKYFDTVISLSSPLVLTTFGNYGDDITTDVLITIQYEIQDGNYILTNGGNLNIRDADIIKGRSLPFQIPSIPNPDVPFVPPNLFDNIVNGITGFTDSFLSGDWFGALGGAFESFINAILGIGGLIVGAIFAYVVPWVQLGLYAILDWVLDSLGWRDHFNTIQGLILYIVDHSIIIWLFLWGLMWSGPFLFAVFGTPKEAPARIFQGVNSIWFRDLKMGILSAVLPKFYLCIIALIGLVYYANVYPELSWVLEMIPFINYTGAG